jgi:1,4-alpha-glucan branching enzyme
MTKKFLLIAAVLCYMVPGAFSQLITVTPALPTDIDGVEVVFDATQGSGGLAGYTGDVYAHTGVITNLSTSNSDWKYVRADWGVNIPACKLTSLGDDKWKLTIGPSIREYYGVPANEQILKLAFVFRSGVQVSGSWLEGKTAENGDIFYDVVLAGLSVKITNPDQDLIFAQLNQPFTVAVSSVMADSTMLYSNNIKIASTTGTSINQSITPTQYGRYLVKAIAKKGTEMVADSFYYYVRPAVTVADLPAGITEGINYMNDTTVVLCLYAPLKQYAFVIGDFNNWLPDEASYMNRTPDGKRYWVQVNHLVKQKEYIYQYLVDGSIRIGDPYADKVSDPWNDKFIDEATYPGLIPYPSGKTTGVATVLQTGRTPYVWQSGSFTPPSVTDLVIYELLIRDFYSTHTFQSVIDTLGYLKRMGINAIELMPVGEFEGNLSWGYNPNYYCAVDKYYGPADTFKKLVDICHQQGIAVIMDMVLNHAFGTSPYVKLYWDDANNRPAANSPYYNPVAKHDFNVGYDMNHESPDTKYYVNRILQYWINEFKVDGYRFDLSKGFTQNNTLGNTAAWGQYDISRINILTSYFNVMKTANPSAVLILEHLADNSEEKELSSRGMLLWGNMNYNYGEAAMGFTTTSDLSWASYTSRSWADPHLVTYMESHDEERQMYKCLAFGNKWGTYSTKDSATALLRGALTATFFFTIPGPKMIWQFGEQGYDYSINWPTMTSNSRLDNKPPRWDYMSQYKRYRLYSTYTSLIKLRTENPVFETTDFSFDLASACKKIRLKNNTTQVVVIGNFDVKTASVNPEFYSEGKWYDYLTGDSINVTNVNAQISLKAGEKRLYMNQRIANPYGIDDLTINSFEVSIAPNPVTDICRILITCPGRDLYQVRFLSSNGADIEDPVIDQVDKYKEINWKPKSAGTYFIRVQIGPRVIVKKVLVI